MTKPNFLLTLGMLCVYANGAFASPDAGVDPSTTKTPTIELAQNIERPTATRTCSPQNPLIGQTFTCEVTVKHSDAFSINVNVPVGWTGQPQSAAQVGADGLTTRRTLSKVPLSMRKIKLLGFTVSWSHKSGAKGQIEIPTTWTAMRSMMADVDEPVFRDFRSAVPDFETFWSRHGILPLIETNWFVIGGLVVLLLAGLGALVFVYIQKRIAMRRAAEIPWVDPRPAHVIADESLAILADKNLPESGEILAFYLRLSEILRTYLENRFGLAIARGVDDLGHAKGLRFPAATSEEIEAALRGHVELTEEGFSTLLECLSLIDYVIFGGIRPHVGQTEADRRRIRFCVELTKKTEPANDGRELDDSELNTPNRTKTDAGAEPEVVAANEPAVASEEVDR